MRYNAEDTALIVVDMQNDFCHPDGELYAPESEEVIDDVNRLVDLVSVIEEYNILYTRDIHQENDPEFDQWGEHCLEGTWGRSIHDDIVLEGRRIAKDTYDAFYGSTLDAVLNLLGVESLIICGTLANVCVQETATSAIARGYDVNVVEDAVGYIEEEQKQRALDHIEFVGGHVIQSSDISIGIREASE